MNVLFYGSTLIMCLIALSFVWRPLVLHAKWRSSGFARPGLLVTIAVILMAVGLYAVIGRPGAAHTPPSSGNTTSVNMPANRSEKIGSVTSMLAGLEERLQEDPDDGSGWLLLAKSYRHLGRENDARSAYARAASLGFADDSFAEQLPAAEDAPATTVEIRGTVTLSAAARESVLETDTVFVIAKAATGAPMPLAVVRKPASELPFEFVLNDSASMVKGNPLSAAERVVVSVKISRTGDALQTSAGLEASSTAVPTRGAQPIVLHIDPAAISINDRP